MSKKNEKNISKIKSSNDNENHKTQDNSERKGRKIILLMGMGLNGINAGGWLPPAETKVETNQIYDDMWALLENIDTFIIGRVTFQGWENYWPSRATDPSSSDFQKKFSNFVDQIQKITFSKTVKSVKWQNSRVVNSDISDEIARIKKLPGKNIAIVGGSGIAQTFTKLNLIDEYQIYLHQVIFGSGPSVLGVLDTERELELIELRQFLSGGIRLHYRPKK